MGWPVAHRPHGGRACDHRSPHPEPSGRRRRTVRADGGGRVLDTEEIAPAWHLIVLRRCSIRPSSRAFRVGPAPSRPILRAVGQLDQFAKETFARETESVTHGAAEWQAPPELNMSEVRLDGLLIVKAPDRLATLAPPWSTVRQAGELVLELK